MDCNEAREELVAFLDGALEAERAGQLKAHLESCAACRGESERLRRAVEATRAVPPTELSADLKRRFFERLAKEKREGLRGWWFERAPRWVLAGAGGLAVAALGVTIWLSGPGVSEEDKIIARHLELFSDYEVISMLPLLEDLEFIEAMDEGE